MKRALVVLSAVFALAIGGYFLFNTMALLKKAPNTPPTTSAAQKIDFSKSGTAVINNPGMKPGALYLVYEEPGAPALSVELKFNEQSLCGDRNATQPCFAFNSEMGMVFGDKHVSVDGYREKDGSVMIAKIIRLAE